MPRKRLPSTTGKGLTDPPPYFLHPASPHFSELYDRMNMVGNSSLRELRQTLHPPLSRKELEIAYAIGTRGDKSPLDAIRVPISKELGIGPVRVTYYHELVYGPHYRSMLEDTYIAGTSFFSVGNRRRDQEDWLTMDYYLAGVLKSLGTSWWAVEMAMAEGVLLSGIPAEFTRIYEVHPATNEFVAAWERTWTNREALISAGDRSRRYSKEKRQFEAQGGLAQDVESILLGTASNLRTEVDLTATNDGMIMMSSPTERDRILNGILVKSVPNGFTMPERGLHEALDGQLMRDWGLHRILLESREQTRDLPDTFANYQTRRRSPLVNSVIYSLAVFLWTNIDSGSPSSSPPIERICAEKLRWVEARRDHPIEIDYFVPDEFYMLIADLLYHCPVVNGLPDEHRAFGKEITYSPEDVHPPPPIWEGSSADEVRQRFRRIYRNDKDRIARFNR